MYSVYKFLDDDSLDDLAFRMNTTVDELERLNGIKDFGVGDLIVVPNNGLYVSYTVKSGDSLYNIAKMYNQDIDVLYAINGIKKGDYIYPGQEILIPSQSSSIYSTRDGDTLSIVSEKMGVSISDIIDDNPNLYLAPDQLIVHKN